MSRQRVAACVRVCRVGQRHFHCCLAARLSGCRAERRVTRTGAMRCCSHHEGRIVWCQGWQQCRQRRWHRRSGGGRASPGLSRSRGWVVVRRRDRCEVLRVHCGSRITPHHTNTSQTHTAHKTEAAERCPARPLRPICSSSSSTSRQRGHCARGGTMADSSGPRVIQVSCGSSHTAALLGERSSAGPIAQQAAHALESPWLLLR